MLNNEKNKLIIKRITRCICEGKDNHNKSTLTCLPILLRPSHPPSFAPNINPKRDLIRHHYA